MEGAATDIIDHLYHTIIKERTSVKEYLMLFCFLYLNLVWSMMFPLYGAMNCELFGSGCFMPDWFFSLIDLHSYLSLAYLLVMFLYTAEKGWDFIKWCWGMTAPKTTNNL